MMVLTCDACGKEMDPHTRAGRKIAIPAHLVTTDQRTFQDRDTLEPTCGLTVDLDLCLVCSNRIYSAAAKELKALNPPHLPASQTAEVKLDRRFLDNRFT